MSKIAAMHKSRELVRIAASLSLKSSARWLSFKDAAAELQLPQPGLLNVQSGLLRALFERHLDVPGDRFCSKTGRLSALQNGVNDIRRKESQADQAAYISARRPSRGLRSQQVLSPFRS
jgi:hypothetical protein